MTLKSCYACKEKVNIDAEVCPQCGTRIEGTKCSDCHNLCPKDARICMWCGKRLQSFSPIPEFKPFSITCSGICRLFTDFNFFPQHVEFFQDKIVITTPGFLKLTTTSEEIPWEKVAGFAHRSGIIWDVIAIETRGQTAGGIGCVYKSDSYKIKQVLQLLEK